MKTYVKPESQIIDIEVDSLLNSFSASGEIEGPVGSKKQLDDLDWEEEW